VHLNLELSGRRVLIVGETKASRRSVARYLAAGAIVYLADEVAAAPTPKSVQPVSFPTTPGEWGHLVAAVDLVVAVAPAAGTDRRLSAACAESRTWLTREDAAMERGHVTLVGGGPGDEGLITVAALDALRAADVVYYDRLAPHRHLKDWAAGAELVNVGKRPGHHAVPQAEIERMIVASALLGNHVVRLKGGDPFVFGRGGEEVLACREAGLQVSVISGISSAIAVPAAAGIPVTHREISHMVTIVSGHAPLSETELEHLVGLGGTLVVLMGVTNLPHLAAGLARHGMPPDMPIAIIEGGFSSSQRTTVASIGTVVPSAVALGVRSPAVMVIGAVVGLSPHAAIEAAQLVSR
jgi:uroporphyrin-III C-methyltransferase